MMKRSLKLGAVCLGMAVSLIAHAVRAQQRKYRSSFIRDRTAQSEAVSETVAETEDNKCISYE